MNLREDPLLFIHGSSGNHLVWKYQLDYFGGRYHAIGIDLIGHGKSEIFISPSQISIKLYSDFVNSFLEALDIEKITLIGQSLGGAVCIQFCLDSPQKVECLGLVNTGAKLGVNPQLLSMLREDFRALGMGLETILGQERGETDQTRRKQEVTEEMLKTDPAVGLADFEACNNFDSREKLSRIRKPTLIVGGSEDVLTPPWYQHYLHEKLENSTLRIIEGVGHYSMFENPDVFNAILSKFLERHL
jgi:pimeloyl-ACP methyl ester carboxylesterase